MTGPAPGFQAFTLKSTGIASQLVTPITVMEAFNPAAPPSTLPRSFNTEALWDTGASKSVVSPNVVSTLQLIPVGVANVSHPRGSSSSPTYLLNFGLPNKVGVAGVLVTEFSPISGGFQAIIGMDIICLGDFVVTNVAGKTCMSFRMPSVAQVDYVVEHKSQLKAAFGRNTPCPCGATQPNGRPIKFKHCHGK